jgi:hypothetical protein
MLPCTGLTAELPSSARTLLPPSAHQKARLRLNNDLATNVLEAQVESEIRYLVILL